MGGRSIGEEGGPGVHVVIGGRIYVSDFYYT
jgi:hypothetical protein